MRKIELMEGEIFKSIKDTDDKYLVSNKGRVFSKLTSKILSPGQRHGYPSVGIKKGNESKTIAIHRLVAQEFIPNPENKEQVNHINGVKTDNYVENLEWVTPKENSRHAQENNLVKPYIMDETTKLERKADLLKYTEAKRKAVVQIEPNNKEIIKEWDSIYEATKALNISNGHISKACKGERDLAGGFKWEFKSQESTFEIPQMGKEVVMVDKDYIVLKKFNMVKEAAKEVGVKPSRMSKWIKSNVTRNGIKFIYAEDYYCEIKQSKGKGV